MTWTLWTTRNKMVVEWIFTRQATDSFLKFLAFLQHLHPLSIQWDRDRLGPTSWAHAGRITGYRTLTIISVGTSACLPVDSGEDEGESLEEEQRRRKRRKLNYGSGTTYRVCFV